MKRVLFVIACLSATVTVGADTHDYDSYIKLVGKPTVTTHWPTAELWNPQGEMTSSGYYLIPAGQTLTCSSNAGTPSDGPWPAAEIAVAGTFKSSTSGGRQNTPETAHLALLPGGRLLGNAGYSTFTAETLDIRGTTEKPSVIEYTYKRDSDAPNLFFKINSVLTSSDPSSAVKFINTAASDIDWRQRATRVSGVRDFAGTILVEGAQAWLRPETTATEFDIAGTLELKDGGNFLTESVSLSVGTLKIGSGSVCEIGKGCVLTVTRAVELAEGARIQIANPFGDWEVGTPPASVKIATFGPAVTRPSDYRTIFDFPQPDNAVGGIPDLVFTETANPDGSVDVSVGYREVVKFSNTTSATTPFQQSETPDYSRLSDKSPISSEKDYYASDVNVYVCNCPETSLYAFQGHSLTIAGTTGKLAVYMGITFDCAHLYLAGSNIRQQNANQWARFDGRLYAQGGKVAFAGKAGVEILSDICGSSDLTMYRDSGISGENQEATSRLFLKGDNSEFSGRFLFGSFEGEETADHPSELHIWNKANLGGALPAFAADGVLIADGCSLIYNGDSVVFDELTRGWTFEGASAIESIQDVTMNVQNRITIGGTLTKRGGGTLLVADVNGGNLSVTAGTLGVTATSAFEDLASLTFADGTKFVVDAVAADLSATAITAPLTGVPVEFASLPETDATVEVATFATAAEAEKFVFVRPKNYRVERVVEEIGGKFVLKAKICKLGLILIFQ